MWHSQDCSESVELHDITGDLSDLIGTPILEASERSSTDNKPHGDADSWTWTFYELRTIKGSVTLRWLGESNGWYSERVDFAKL